MQGDQLGDLRAAIRSVAESITPSGAMPATLPNGIRVGCLTEAVIAVAESLNNVAAAIRESAE